MKLIHMNKTKDTISKLLYMFLPLLLSSPFLLFYHKLLGKLSEPRYQDIVLRTLIAVFLLLLYAIAWIIYLKRHKNRCPFCNSKAFELIETKISNYPDLRKQGLVRYRYTCKSCNKNFEEYVKPSSKPR
jgi:hypothetical protein